MGFSRESKWLRLLAVVAAFALVATGCGSGDDDGADGDAPAPPALDEFVGTGVFGGPFTAETVEDGIARLAESGIAVIPDGGGSPIVEPTEPASPLALLEFQARNLVADAAGNGGFLGANLDALVLPDPDAPDGPVPSQVLAAYVHGVDTPGAELSRELIGAQDLAEPDDVIFPSMVMTLFVSDIARAVEELAETAPGSPGTDDDSESAAPVTLGDDQIQLISARQPICPDFAGFINEVIADVVRVLKIPTITVPDTGIPILTQILQAGADLFVGFLNFAIDAAATFLIDGIKVLLKPVFSVVTTIAAVFAITSSIVNALRPWTVQTIPDDISVHRGVGAAATQEIAIQVTVPGLEEWPDTVTSCASSLGVALPPLRPHGGRVKWNLIDPRGLTSVASKEDTLDDTSKARITLDIVGQETHKQHNEGVEHSELVKVNAILSREEVETFRDTIKALVRQLFAGVPAIIRAHLTYYSDHAADAILDSITDDVINLHKPVWLTVTYHGDPREEDEPEGPERPGTSGEMLALPDPCALITVEEAASARGGPLDGSTPRDIGGADLAEGARSGRRCDFTEEGDVGVGGMGTVGGVPLASVQLVVHDLGAAAQDVFGQHRDAMALYGGGVVDIPDLGDDAFSVTDPGGAGLVFARYRNLMLNVSVLVPGAGSRAVDLMHVAVDRL